jgi:ketosteroid isomerase-like protein
MARTPQDVFAAHAAALASGDVEAILRDYSEDAVLLTVDGPIRGRDALSNFFTSALSALPRAEFVMGASVFAGDALLLTWSATSASARIEDAVDTFIFRDGMITLQTMVFSLTA